MWEWWCAARKQNELTGAWQIDFAAFAVVVPRAVREDDEARLEVIRLMQICAAVMNDPKTHGGPAPDED